MGNRTQSGRSSNMANLALALQAFFLNLTLNTANGSEYYHVQPMMIPGPVWSDPVSARLSLGGLQGYQTFNDGHRDNGGFRTNQGYYDDLLANKQGYDRGKVYGGLYDYGRGNVVGGGYKDLNGRNKGHMAAGFATSYRKDESGDKSTYYDDGLGHTGRLQYGAHDARFRDQGGNLRRGGFHDSNLNRNALANSGRYGDALTYRAFGGQGGYSSDGRGYGLDRGFRGGRGLSLPPPFPPIFTTPPPKNSALYVIPLPDKLYIDQPPQ